MQARVSRDIFLQGLRIVTQVSTRYADGIVVAVEEDNGRPRLRLSRTDLTTTFHCWTHRIWDDEPGEIAVAREIAAWVSLEERSPFLLFTDGEELVIECERHRATFRSRDLNVELKPYPTPANELSLPGTEVRKVSFAAAKDLARPVLTGVLVRTGNGIILAAADGYRLAEVKISGRFPEMQFIAPVGAMDKWFRAMSILGIDNEPFRIAYLDNRIVLEASNENLTAQMISEHIDGQYPDYNQLKIDYRTVISVGVRDLKQALRMTRATADDDDTVILGLKPEESTLEVLSSSRGEKTRVEIDVSLLSSPEGEVRVAVCRSWLQESLKVLDDEKVFLAMSTPNSPLAIYDLGWRYIVMPRTTDNL